MINSYFQIPSQLTREDKAVKSSLLLIDVPGHVTNYTPPILTYMERVNVFLKDSSGRQITCALFNKRVGFKQLIDIRFSEPARVYRNTIYKLVVELQKHGWYPMGTYSKHTNVSAGVRFTFCVGEPTESFRDCIIRSILFTPPKRRSSLTRKLLWLAPV